MNEKEMMKWIDDASYAQLLHKLRFDPTGSPWFVGKVGVHFQRVMAKKKRLVDHVNTSKEVGWSEE